MKEADGDVIKVRSAVPSWPFSYRFPVVPFSDFFIEREFTSLALLPPI